MILHQGTQFEILNPHESLNFARIVSYIEDVEDYSSSRASSESHRGSFLSGTSISTMKSDDAPEAVPPDKLSDGTHVGQETRDGGGNEEEEEEEEEDKGHSELVGDASPRPMPSISERLEHNTPEDDPHTLWGDRNRSDTLHSQLSEIGEPGPCEEIVQGPIGYAHEHHSHTYSPYPDDHQAWPLCGALPQPAPAPGEKGVRALPTPMTRHPTAPANPQKKGSLRRLRRIVQTIPFFRRRRE